MPGGGAASVAVAVDRLCADRIAHAVLATEDDELVRKQICLDVCPTANLNLQVFPSIEPHPLPHLIEAGLIEAGLIEAGVVGTINSDDPLLFGPDLVEELEICRKGMGLSDAALAQLARNLFVHSDAPDALKIAGLAAIDQWLGDLLPNSA